MHYDTTTVLIALGIFKCAVSALPIPEPRDPRLYGFLFRFLHALVFNFRNASLHAEIPEGTDVMEVKTKVTTTTIPKE